MFFNDESKIKKLQKENMHNIKCAKEMANRYEKIIDILRKENNSLRDEIKYLKKQVNDDREPQLELIL